MAFWIPCIGLSILVLAAAKKRKKVRLDEDHRQREDEKQVVLSKMYDDWIRISSCPGRRAFDATWAETRTRHGLGDDQVLLHQFRNIWASLNPTLAEDLNDRIKTLHSTSSRDDHTEQSKMYDTPGDIAERRSNIEFLLWKSIAPEIVRPLALQC